MADSLREVAVTAFDARLKTILKAGGYETNAGLEVAGWKDTPHDIDKLPALSWRDVDDVIPLAGITDDHELNMEVDIVVVKTSTVVAMKQMRKVVADVIKVLGTDLTLGGVVHDIVNQSQDASIQHDDKKILVATLTFTLMFTSGHFDPYA